MTSTFFKQEAYKQETDEVFITLVTMTSDELDEPMRFGSDPYEKLTDLGEDIYGVTSNGENFIFAPFDIWLPRDDKTGAVSAKIVIANTDQRIVGYARSVTKPIDVKIECVLSSDVDYVEFSYDHFQLSNVNYNSIELSGDITLDYWGLEPFPSGRFTPSGFPGLF